MRRRLSLPPRLAAALLAALFSVAGRAEGFVSVTRSDPAPAAPEVPAPESVDTGGGTAEPERRMALTAHEPIALAINRVRVRIHDQVAVTTVEQVFQSNVDRVLQARYVFPLGPRAHVAGYAIWERGEKLVGELLDVERAEALYREVTAQELTRREEGSGVAQEVQRVVVAPRDPGILRQMAPGSFETHIYPILPYALKQLELLYAEAIEAEGGWCRWSFPLEAAAVFANPIGELAIEVSLADGAGVGEVLCSWPDAVVTREGDVVRVTLAARAARPEAPFELRWRTGLAPGAATALAHRPGEAEEAGYALVRVGLPELARQERALDVVLLVDASASLRGDKRSEQRAALAGLCAALKPSDRLALVRFAEAPQIAPGGLRPATSGAREELERALLGEAPGRRTRLAPALAAAFDLLARRPDGEGRTGLVVLASDGVTEEDPAEVLAAASAGPRLLVLATGQDDDLGLLSDLADRHGGAVWVPKLGERDARWLSRRPDILQRPYGYGGWTADAPGAEPPSSLLRSLRRPAVTGARLRDPSGVLFDAYPVLPCRAWPAGGVATFVVRYRRGGALPVTFEATADGGPISQPLVLTLPEREEHHRFVASFWARARVLELLRHHPTGPKDPNRAEIVELSLAHRFMTPYTAFLSLPDAERRRLLLGPMPPDDAAAMLSFSKFAGGAPEAEVWLLIAIGLITAVAVARRRTPTVQGGLS